MPHGTPASPANSHLSLPGIGSESYWTYSHLVESAWLEHGPFASWIVSELRPSVLAELGTHNGFSYFAFCEAVFRLGLETKCFAVDTWEGDDHAGFYGEDIYTLVSRVNNERYSSFSTLLRGYFDDHVASFDDGSIDLLHIDGRHGYEDAKHDFESWLPKVSKRGVVLFHDIAEHDRGFGVWQLWDEVSARYPSFHFEHGHGLGVLGVGKNLPAELTKLFGATKAEADAIRAFYEDRGRLVSDQYLDSSARVELFGVANELNGIKNSLAWKSTRPLRWAIGLVPRSVRRKLRGVEEPDPS